MRAQLLRSLLVPGVVSALLAVATPSRAYHEAGSEWVGTSNAYTLRQGELSLGLIRWELGVFDEVMVGTLPALWFTSPWLGAPIPNGFVKLRDWWHGPVAISLQAGLLFVDGDALVKALSNRDEKGNLLVMSAVAAATWRSRRSYSLGLSLAFTKADLGGSSTAASVSGTIVSDTFRVTPFAEWRLSRVVALQLNATVLAHHEEPNARVALAPRSDLTLDVDISYSDAAPNGAYAVWPALACSFRNINFLVGAGYGYRWVPIVDVMLNERGPVFALDFFVRF